MKLILGPLFILIIIALCVQFISLGSFQNALTSDPSIDATNDQLTGLTSYSMNVSLIAGFVTLFLGIIVIGILSGLNISVLGSTVQISERSQKLLFNGLLYGGLWGLFSVLATIGVTGTVFGIFSIPLFGAIFYGILSLLYIIGISQQIDGAP